VELAGRAIAGERALLGSHTETVSSRVRSSRDASA
jgi:hypothetical protein